jgi:hypothetical protein
MFWSEGFRKQVPAQLGTSESNFSVKFAAEASRPSRFSGEARGRRLSWSSLRAGTRLDLTVGLDPPFLCVYSEQISKLSAS